MAEQDRNEGEDLYDHIFRSMHHRERWGSRDEKKRAMQKKKESDF